MLVPKVDVVGEKVGVDRLQLGVMRLYQVQHLLVLGLLGKKNQKNWSLHCSVFRYASCDNAHGSRGSLSG